MSRTHVTPRSIVWLLALAMTMAGLSFVSGPAFAADDGHVTGTVTGTVAGVDDVALEGVQVTAFRDDGDGWVDGAFDYTDSDGNYDVGDLPTGTYRLQFYDDSDAGYLVEFYDNATSVETATDIDVSTGETAAGKDAQLTTPGRITGTVTGTVPGADDVLLEGVQVTAFRDDGDGWTDVSYAGTDDQGRYDIGDLPTGTYRLQFYDDSDAGYPIEFYDDATSIETATDIDVTTGATASGKDALLTAPGHITGTVTGTVPGADDVTLEGIQVIAFRDDGDGWVDVGYADTDDQGRYDLGGLPTGTYRVRFDDFDDSEDGYTQEFYDDANNVETAVDVDVDTGEITSGIDAQLTTYSQITGRITGTVTGTVPGADDVTLEGIQVIAFRDDGDGWVDVGYADTDDQGGYDMAGLPTGTYRVRFDDFDDSEDGYTQEFYDDVDSVETAVDVDVEAGDITSGIDAQLTKYGHITGTVTGTGDVGLGELGVTAFRDDGDGWVDVKYTTTDDQGRYDMAGLTTGTYRLQFSDDSDGGYLTEFYNDATSVETATDIDVETGEIIAGIDAQLTTPSHITGTVTGTVEGDDDVQLQNVSVSAYRDDGDGWAEIGYTSTDGDGDYDLAGLPAGTYRLEFYDNTDSGYLNEFYDNATSVETATDVEVTTGATASGKDVQLTTPGHITGTVTGTVPGDDDARLEGVQVIAFRDDGDGWTDVSYAYTDDQGRYDIGGLSTGTYRLQLDDDDDSELGYIREFYPDADFVDSATDIDVQTGETIAGIDAQLTRYGQISGTVTGTGDVGLGELGVSVFRDDGDGWVEVKYATTDDQGRYDMAGLTTGTYRLQFHDDSDGGYLTEFYNDATSVETATDIDVEMGEIIAGIDAELTMPSHITGTVTGTVEGDDDVQLQDVSVSAYRDDGDGWAEIGYTSTDGDGDYDLAGLPAGTYRLGFYDTSDAGYLTEFYDNADSVETATDVEVTDGSTAAGKDAQLTTPAVSNTAVPTITGTAQVGSTLTATTGTWDPSDGVTFTYRWLIAGDAVGGADSATYVPVSGDVGKTIKVEVTASATGHTPGTATSAATFAVTAAPTPAVVNTAVPTITGTARVGSTLSATTGTWDRADGLTFTYRWLVAGNPVAGADSATYVPQPGDVDKAIKVEVTANATGHTPGIAGSHSATVSKGILKASKKPKVTGKVKKKATLNVSAGRWTPAKVKVSYTWFAGNSAIAKGSKLKFVGQNPKAVTGKTITVRVRISAPGYATVTIRVKVHGKLKRA